MFDKFAQFFLSMHVSRVEFDFKHEKTLSMLSTIISTNAKISKNLFVQFNISNMKKVINNDFDMRDDFEKFI